jgi:TPR repeat protein
MTTFRSINTARALCFHGARLFALILCLFLALVSFAAESPTNRPPQVPDHPVSKLSEQLRARWGNVSSNELFNTAQSGHPEAQYFYGQAEASAAWKDHHQAEVYEANAKYGKVLLSEAEKSAARAKWSKVADTELRKAAATGDRGACWFFYDFHLRTGPDKARQAVEWIKRAASQSYPAAEYSLARWYLPPTNWVAIPENIPLALELLQHAADNGVEIAQHELAEILLAGEIVPQDIGKGIAYLQKAADQSCIHAQYELAAQYANGNGEPRSPADTPVALLKKAAGARFNLALFALAERCRTGLGVHRDFVRAILLYRAAYEVDRWVQYGPSTSAYSVLDFVGPDLEPRFPLASDFVPFAHVLSAYCKATQHQDLNAMHELGKAYLTGENVPRDLAEAFRWFDSAANHGHVEAARARDILRGRLGSEQLKQARTSPPTLQELIEAN